MGLFFGSLPPGSIDRERMKGIIISIYFRWMLIVVVLITLSIQLLSGYRAQSTHSIFLVMFYFLMNILFWIAARNNYDPPYLGYLSAVIDVTIITLNLHFSCLQNDKLAITSAATLLLYPIMFVLYTFRMNRKLLIFQVIFTLLLFNFNYFYFYLQQPDVYMVYLSTSPTSVLFKSIYFFFVGFLCIYLQHYIMQFIQTQLAEANDRAQLDLKIKTEEQKNKYARQLIEQEKEQNKRLEKVVRERTGELIETRTQLITLQKENLQSQYDVLKQQVNPHFLFNSLNVLTSLIKLEPDLAEKFSEQLSQVYRYVLENKDNELVSLDTELHFLEAYLFLVNIRFVDKMRVLIDIDAQNRKNLLIPLAMQLLIENAIKHNIMSKKQPLRIDIFVDENGCLNVINNLQQRPNSIASTGIGLINISRRYQLLNLPVPVFGKMDGNFVAKIPLVRASE